MLPGSNSSNGFIFPSNRTTRAGVSVCGISAGKSRRHPASDISGSALRLLICFGRPVPVDVIHAEHRDHRHVWRPFHLAQVFEHETRQFQHDRSSAAIFGNSSSNGCPIFPPTCVVNFVASIRRAGGRRRFPLGSRDADDLAGQRSINSRISVVTATPAARAANKNSFPGGIAGVATIKSARVKSSILCSPSRT